jgi:hypothetical protein
MDVQLDSAKIQDVKRSLSEMAKLSEPIDESAIVAEQDCIVPIIQKKTHIATFEILPSEEEFSSCYHLSISVLLLLALAIQLSEEMRKLAFILTESTQPKGTKKEMSKCSHVQRMLSKATGKDSGESAKIR